MGGFAEAAIFVLDAFEPVAGALDPVLGHVFADVFEAADDLPCAVDVVDTPAAEPATFGFLFELDEANGFAYGGVVDGVAEVAEAFECAACDVGAGGVLDGVVVGEGDVFEDGAGDGAVERGPATVFVLHGECPVDAAFDGGGDFGGIAGAVECHGDHGGVVDIGVVGVVEFEVPPAGLDFTVDVVFPVAGESAFFGDEPVDGFFHFGVGDVHAGIGEGVGGDAGIPDGGEARLNADGVVLFVVDHEVIELVFGFFDAGVIFVVTEAAVGDDHVAHAGEDGTEAVGVVFVGAFEDPFFDALECHFTERGEFGALPDFEEFVGAEEDVFP